MYTSDLISYKKIIDNNIEYNTINVVDLDGNSLLHYICSRYGNDIEYINKLIENNININKQNKYGLTPLHCLIKNNCISNKDSINILLNNGANPNLKTKNMFNSLHFACIYSGNTDIIKLLLDNGANINELCKNDNSSLLLLCRYHGNNKESIQLLVDNGANINHINSSSISCLYTLYNDNIIIKDDYISYIKVFKYLLDNGANPNHIINIENYMGSILHYMLNDVILLDLDKFEDINRYKIFCNLIELIMKYKADPNIKDSDNNTLLDIIYSRISNINSCLSVLCGSNNLNNGIEDYEHLIEIIEYYSDNRTSSILNIFNCFMINICDNKTIKYSVISNDI